MWCISNLGKHSIIQMLSYLKNLDLEEKKSSKFGFWFLDSRFQSKALPNSEIKNFNICRLKAITFVNIFLIYSYYEPGKPFLMGDTFF